MPHASLVFINLRLPLIQAATEQAQKAIQDAKNIRLQNVGRFYILLIDRSR
jgi:hypothetical protein